MDVDKAYQIINGYVNWWKDSVEIHQEGNAVRIVCPMLDRNNDHMSIYLAEDNNSGGFIMTDLGVILDDLALSGCDVLSSEPRLEKLENVILGYGVSRENSELYVRCGQSALFQSMNMLMQSMATVDDLFFTVRDSVRSYFVDDVRAWLDEKEIRYLPDIRVSGLSGFETKFEFVIPQSRGVAPERYIKTVSTPSESMVKNALFGWSDIQSARGGDAKSYLFLNQENAKNEQIDSSLITACKNYGVSPVVWNGNADSVYEELAA